MPTSITKKPKGRYLAIPLEVFKSEDYRNLSGTAVKLLCVLLFQFNGDNNGNLKATWAVMSTHGFRSTDTLARALKELLTAKLIIKKRESRGGMCALYAVSWLPITPPKKPSSHQNQLGKKVSLKELLLRHDNERTPH